jgi:putative NADH-flavin reductase
MNKKKIAMFGVTGDMSELLATEALKRGHSVTAIMPGETELKLNHPNLIVLKGDPRKKEDVSKYAKDHDVVIAFNEPTKEKPGEHLDATHMYIEGTKEAGVQHLVAVGHPFGKWAGNNQQAYDNYRPILQAQRDALTIFRNERDLNWSYIHSPEPEKRNGEYTMSNDIICTHLQGEHKIQPKDFTESLLDDAEKTLMELHEQQGGDE